MAVDPFSTALSIWGRTKHVELDKRFFRSWKWVTHWTEEHIFCWLCSTTRSLSYLVAKKNCAVSSFLADLIFVIFERARWRDCKRFLVVFLKNTTVVRGEGRAPEIPATKSARVNQRARKRIPGMYVVGYILILTELRIYVTTELSG